MFGLLMGRNCATAHKLTVSGNGNASLAETFNLGNRHSIQYLSQY